jgi:hypothetical protein
MAAHLATCKTQPSECLRTGYFVYKLKIDVEQIWLSICLTNDVVIPNLLR